MKNIFHYTFFFFVLYCSAQTKQDTIMLNEQKKYFEIAENALKVHDSLKALNAYHSVRFFNNLDGQKSNNYEIIARKKIDSIVPIFEKKSAKKWIGKWKLKHLLSRDYNYEYIVFTEDEVLFYDKKSKTPIRVEKIKFQPSEDNDIELSYSILSFKNNEIWGFSIKVVKNEKRLITEIIRNAKGEFPILLDERRSIIDPIMRKKALEFEIRTYYVKVK